VRWRTAHRDMATRSPIDLGAVLAKTDRRLQGQSALARWHAGAFAETEDALLTAIAEAKAR
jgi:hypothetical protein